MYTVFACLIFSLCPLISHAEEILISAEKVAPVVLRKDCKIVSEKEPRGQVTYKVRTSGGVKVVTRPMFGDLCTSPTAQFITKLYSYLSDDDTSPIIGMVGENDDDDQFTLVSFSSFAFYKK
jgi:hypothetical protein